MNVIGFDDGPFEHAHRGDVLLVGAVCAGVRIDGVVSGRIRRDGTDSTRRMIELVERSQFQKHVRAVMLHGIAVGGFNGFSGREPSSRSECRAGSRVAQWDSAARRSDFGFSGLDFRWRKRARSSLGRRFTATCRSRSGSLI